MTSRVRSPPPIEFRHVPVMGPIYEDTRPNKRDRQRRIFLYVSIILLSFTILLTWPSTVEDPTGDTVFEGEVWGDLTVDGEIWGEHVSDLDNVYLRHWSDGGGVLRVNVINVSQVGLFPGGDGTTLTVPCENRSFMIIADNGSFDAYLSDLEFECVYQEFSGSYPGYEEVYKPDVLVTSVEGHGIFVQEESTNPYRRGDVTLDDCVVVVNGVEYHQIAGIDIPEDETPYVEVRGDIGSRGSIRVGRGLDPRVNGTLVVENFLHEKDGRSQMYRRISFEGEDILIHQTGYSDYGTGGMFKWFEQWGIEVILSSDTTVDIDETSSTFIWAEMILIALLIALLIYTRNFLRQLRNKG